MVMSTLPPLPLPEEMRQWDEASFALGLPEVMLMENASRAALRALEAHIRYLQEQTDNAIVQLRRATGLQAENRSAQTAAGAAGKEN